LFPVAEDAPRCTENVVTIGRVKCVRERQTDAQTYTLITISRKIKFGQNVDPHAIE